MFLFPSFTCQVPTMPNGQRAAEDGGNFMFMSILLICAVILYLFRPNSLRRSIQGSQDKASRPPSDQNVNTFTSLNIFFGTHFNRPIQLFSINQHFYYKLITKKFLRDPYFKYENPKYKHSPTFYYFMKITIERFLFEITKYLIKNSKFLISETKKNF